MNARGVSAGPLPGRRRRHVLVVEMHKPDGHDLPMIYGRIFGRLRERLGAGLFLGFAVVCFPAAAVEEAGTEAQFLSRTRQLTYEGRRSGEGYFSPDGDSLIFQSEREPGNPFYQIYILDLLTGDSHRVSPGTGKTTCAWFHPESPRVLFASTHLDPAAGEKQREELQFRASGQQRRYSWDYDPEMELFSSQRDGTGLVRLSNSFGYDAEGAYSPDGRQIVFCSLRAAYPTNRLSAVELKRLETDPSWFGEIYLMDADGSNPRRLTHAGGYDGGPFFSPDGERIIWRRFEEDGVTADIYTMKLDGTDVRRITDFKAMSWAPFFHPSGDYAIFTANKLGFGNFELFIVDAAGTREPVRVTFTDGFDGLPVFSPDGRRLCWTSSRTGTEKSQLFLADWDHEAAKASLEAAPERGHGPEDSAHLPSPAMSTEITVEDLRRHVMFLASEELEGRMTGSNGARSAAEYAVRRLEEAGVQPAGEEGGWYQPFQFTAGVDVIPDSNTLVIASGEVESAFEVETDFRPLSFTANATVTGDVVFAGYGLSVPGKAGEGYQSYAGLDVSNKVVLVLRYVPEGVEPARRQVLNRYAGVRYKAMIAREHGAKAILFAAGPNSPNAGELIRLSFDSSLSGSGIVAVSVSSNAVAAILKGSGKTLGELQSGLDKESPHAEGGFVIPGARVDLSAAVKQIRETGRNVLGVIPPPRDPEGGSYVLVGAHYDHLGFGEAGAMLRKGEEETVHPGADDNASGTAVVLELAAQLAADRRTRPGRFAHGVLFALWSGEEIGLIGSSHFASHPAVPLSNLVGYVNFDMVGRLRDNKLSLQGIGSSDGWRKLIEKRNVPAGFDLALQEDPYLPTDVTSFYPKGVPVLNFFTGSHEEYHRPTDTPDTLNYEGTLRIALFARALVEDLSLPDLELAYMKVERSEGGGGSREALRAYLGTIPDYATEVAGVKLSGVRGGSPADQGGLRGGDIIVEFGGQKIANIYDYTYALDAVKIGQPTKVTLTRDGKRVTVTVIPAARK